MFPESVILVVGGESGESAAIAGMLADRHRVLGVERPEEALTHACDDVDLVISQLDTPEYSGLQLLRSWRSRDTWTPFLFVTEGDDVCSVVEAMKLGAGDCLVKPINAGELRTAVSKLLERDMEATGDQKPSIDIPAGTSLEDLERAAVKQALARHHGNRTHAAKTLGISVRTLQRKLKAWGVPVLSPPQNDHPKNHFLYAESPIC